MTCNYNIIKFTNMLNDLESLALVTVLCVTTLSITAVSDANNLSAKSKPSSQDMDLIKLYLEEFRLELMSVKSQLARLGRSAKLVRTGLKELRTARCSPELKDALDYLSIDCPAGFQLSSPTSCYRFVHERLTWLDAQLKCKVHSGHLLALETDTEQRFIKNHLMNTRKLQNCDFWTSGTDQLEEGVWVWNTTGVISHRTLIKSHGNWHNGEPNNSNGDEHCLLLDWFARWSWNDASCQTERACYVCEIDM